MPVFCAIAQSLSSRLIRELQQIIKSINLLAFLFCEFIKALYENAFGLLFVCLSLIDFFQNPLEIHVANLSIP
jgi:hypothetical protein